MGDNEKPGLIDLPPEIRIRIYEYLLLPEPEVQFECTDHCGGQKYATQKKSRWQDKGWSNFIESPGIGAENSSDTRHFRGHGDRGQGSFSGGSLGRASSSQSPSATVAVRQIWKPIPLPPIGCTCIMRPTVVRLFSGDCYPWALLETCRGSIAILCTSRQIFQEAVAVLYENIQLNVRAPTSPARGTYLLPYPARRIVLGLPTGGKPHIRRLHLDVSTDRDKPRLSDTVVEYCQLIPQHLPNLKVFSLHLDVDLTTEKQLDAGDFDALYAIAEQVRFIIDVHIVKDWKDGVNGSAWAILTRGVTESKRHSFDLKAKDLREEFVEALKGIFAGHGKVLRIAEE